MTADESGPSASGIPLAKYAALQAALAEPFPLDEVLATEGLDEAGWSDADLSWTEKLAEDEKLLESYRTALGVAEDKLTRPVEPLESDLAAWVAFLGAFENASAPGDFLTEKQLGVNDLSRLKRSWDRQMEKDPGLEKRMARMKRGGPGALPELKVGPRKLPPGITRAAEEPRPDAGRFVPPPEPAEEMPLDVYAALSAELDAVPKKDAQRVLDKFGISAARREQVDKEFAVRFGADPEERRTFTALRGHHRALTSTLRPLEGSKAPRVEVPSFAREMPVKMPFSAPLPAPLPPPVPFPGVAGPLTPAMRALADPETTQFDLTIEGIGARKPALPFGSRPSPEFVDALARGEAPKGGSDGGTVVADEAIAFSDVEARAKELALESRGEPAVAEPRKDERPVRPDISLKPMDDEDSVTVVRPSPALSPPQSPPEGDAAAFAVQTVTGMLSPFVQEGLPFKQAALPFKQEAPPRKKDALPFKDGLPFKKGTEPPPPRAEASTELRADTGTVSSLISPLAKPVLPFGVPTRLDAIVAYAPPSSVAPPSASPASLPPKSAVPRSQKPSQSVPPPSAAPPSAAPPPMSLERHASLCVEMSMDGMRASDVLARYELSEDQKNRADRYWKARMAREPSLRAVWNRAFETYHAWFIAQLRR